MSSHSLAGLRSVPLFSELDDRGLERLSTIANPFDAAAGHVLMERGQSGLGMFIIESGRVRVDVAGSEAVTLGPGDFVGELSVLTDAPRTARVVVAEAMTGLAIRRQDLTALLLEEPTIALAMLRALAVRYARN
jgi:CRP-like cAMP-binding protein